MVSTASLFATTALAVAGYLTTVQAHGYMYIPLTEFKGTPTGAWIVQITPQFQANWESVANDEELIALYVEKAKEAGYANNIRKLLDSDTNLYGANCGFSNPDAKAKDPPSDGTATFERGLAHHGPCEIWLDDVMVLHNDDCAKAFSIPDYMSIKSVFKPIDYSSCSSSGCMFRFYWLAFQGVNGKYVWQIYKDCIPLTGPGAGKTSTAGAQSSTPEAQTQQAETPEAQTPTSPNAPSQKNAPATENKPSEAQTPTRWNPAPQMWNQAPVMNAQPPTTNAPAWPNAPAAEMPGTVAPFTQNQGNPAPALNMAPNAHNSYSFKNEGQNANNPSTANTPETNQAQKPSTFSF